MSQPPRAVGVPIHPARAHRALAPAAIVAMAVLLPALLVMIMPRRAAAQPVPAFGGLELRIGAAEPEQADAGFSVAADLGIGTVWSDRLQLLLGANLFIADVDIRAGGSRVTGGYTVAGGRVALRYDITDIDRVTPYLVAQLGGHAVSAGDVEQPEIRERLEGFYLGAGLGAGVSYAFGELRTTRAVLEARRVQAGRVDHWALEIGLRFSPRRDDDDALAAARARVDADRRRIAAERRGAALAATLPEAIVRELAAVQRDATTLPALRATARGLELPLAADAFAAGSAELSPAASADLGPLGDVLERHFAHAVVVEAHAPDGLTDDAARALALRRAGAVRAVLVGRGVEAARITTRTTALPPAGDRAAVVIVVEP